MPVFNDPRGFFWRGIPKDFAASDLDEAADTKYYGFIEQDGAWVILKLVTSAGTLRYAKGKISYQTNWTGRAALSYGYYDEVF